MTHDEMVEFVAGWIAAWRVRDAERLTSFYTSDAVVESPMTGRVEGLNAIHRSFAQLLTAFPDIEIQQEDVLVDGNRAAIGFKFTATHRGDLMGLQPTGKHIVFRGVILLTMKDGDIVHERRVYDFTGFLMKIGLLKAKPS